MSRASDGKVLFGPWLPDLPATDNAGVTEALNVLPVNQFYAAYKPLATSGDAVSERPRGAISALDNAGAAFLYVGTETTLQQRNGDAWTDKSGATYTTASDGYWRFVQFDSLVIGTNYDDVPQAIEVGDGGNFADLALVGTAPQARVIGIVGRHVVLGDTVYGVPGAVPYRIQWSRINSATEWPTPGSADALSKQAGEQYMPSALGAVTGIIGNDQFGIVFQKSGISRMTYVGGDVVYQFDVIDSTRGAICPNAIIQVGDLAYFIAADGFYVTDGVSVRPIGAGKFDQWFMDRMDTGYKHRVYGAMDRLRNLLYFAFPDTSASDGTPNNVLIYNPREERPTHASDMVDCLITGLTTAITLEGLDALFATLEDVTPPLDSPFWQGGNEVMLAFDSSNKLGTFSGTPAVAVIDSQESELHPGLRTFISGIKPIVQDNSAVTVALGTRDSFSDSVTYTSDIALTSRTGVADFRKDARYVRARVNVTGDFPAAQGIHFQAQEAGAA